MDNKDSAQSRTARKKVITDLVKDPIYVPMKEKELAMFLQVPREQREELREVLKILEAEGRIKGRLRAGTLLVLALRILLNKNFMLLVRRWRRSGGK